MQHYLVEEGFIPLKKSEYMRKAALFALRKDYDPVIGFLEQQEKLPDDLISLKRAMQDLKQGKQEIYVGESGTLFRFLQFISWKYDLGKKFIKKGTLVDRKIYSNPDVVHMSAEQRLKLDKGTSQWESIAVICGSEERVPNPAHHLDLTYRMVDEWQKQGPSLEVVYDDAILAQAETFLRLLKNEQEVDFLPGRAEDYCFARAFGYMTREQGKMWSSLQGHETKRLDEMERALQQPAIDSLDHRVVQAVVMKKIMENKPYHVADSSVVKKSWPQFWEFIAAALAGRIDI
jgi:hypothetical protein